jgi:hypothetical protein
VDLINSHMSNCFWDDYEGHKKLHLANWYLVCMKKGFGGLEVPNLKDLNLCLLGNWVKRYIRDVGKLWRSVIDKKNVEMAIFFILIEDKLHPSGRVLC